MKVTLIAGARSNFMKIAPIIHAIKRTEANIHYRLVHTGQHYDKNMSETFFEQLNIPKPDVNLDCHAELDSASHQNYEAIVLAVAQKQFLSLNLDALKAKKSVVYDVKGILGDKAEAKL